MSDDTQVISVPLNTAFLAAHGGPIGHSGVRTRCLRALFVGRMEWLKGPDTAIAGLAEAIRRGVDVRLTFAGLRIEEMRSQLEKMGTSLGVQDRIHWAGTPTLSELVEIYRSHDVLLFPSRIVEGLGMVNVEAIACGVPVIGTAHSGSAEVIYDGVTGFRVAKDDPVAIGKHMGRLHHDRALLERLSASAVTFADRYRPGVVLQSLESELFRIAGEAQ